MSDATQQPRSGGILCVIQARSGSKGIPDKNIHPVLGHPLMAYSIQAALDARLINHVVVSTDSERYAEIARSYGAEVPFLRPAELAGDTVTSAASLHHAVLAVERLKGVTFDYVVELPCVAPLRDGADVDGALTKLMESGADAVISVSDTGEKHPMRLKRLVDDRIVDFTSEYPEPGGCSRRQDLKPPAYIRNGAIYAMTRALIVEHQDRIGADPRPYIMPPERSINIDEPMDLALAECMMRQGFGNNRPSRRQAVRIDRFEAGRTHRVLVTAPMHFLPAMREEICRTVDAVFAYGADRETVQGLLPGMDAWLCAPCPTYLIDGELLGHGDRLKIIATPSTGSNHIDRTWCEAHNLPVACLKGTEVVHTIHASSEFCWALITATTRRLPQSVELVRQGYWRDVEDQLRAVEFNGKTMGIIGYGRIGANVARFAHAFRMAVIAYDPFREIDDPHVQQAASHNEVLAAADILLIAVHLDASTAGMVDRAWFDVMKPGVIFINISRGEIVDETALLAALESGQVGAAGLDVLSNEFLADMRTHPLVRYARHHDNLIITPHIAGLTVDSEHKAARFAFGAIRAALNLPGGDPGP